MHQTDLQRLFLPLLTSGTAASTRHTPYIAAHAAAKARQVLRCAMVAGLLLWYDEFGIVTAPLLPIPKK